MRVKQVWWRLEWLVVGWRQLEPRSCCWTLEAPNRVGLAMARMTESELKSDESGSKILALDYLVFRCINTSKVVVKRPWRLLVPEGLIAD